MFETQPNFEVEQANKGGQIQDGLADHSVMRMWGPALMVCLIVTSGLVSAFRSVDRGNAHAPLQCTGSFRPTSVHPVTAGSISLSTAAAFLVLPTLLVKAVFSNLFEKKKLFPDGSPFSCYFRFFNPFPLLLQKYPLFKQKLFEVRRHINTVPPNKIS